MSCSPLFAIHYCTIRLLACLLLTGSLATALAPTAQADAADVYFSRGVQAFFDEDWARAEAYFDRAISFSAGEPRSYYFRGLARFERGQPLMAESDMRQGAVLEAGKGLSYGLGSALRATTGQGRVVLDRVRNEILSGMPSYDSGGALTGGSQRELMALRPQFRLPLEAIATMDSPTQLVELVAAARPTTFDTRGGPAEAIALDPPTDLPNDELPSPSPTPRASRASRDSSSNASPASPATASPAPAEDAFDDDLFGESNPGEAGSVAGDGSMSPGDLLGIVGRTLGRMGGLSSTGRQQLQSLLPGGNGDNGGGAGNPFGDDPEGFNPGPPASVENSFDDGDLFGGGSDPADADDFGSADASPSASEESEDLFGDNPFEGGDFEEDDDLFGGDTGPSRVGP